VVFIYLLVYSGSMVECPMCHYVFDTPKLKCKRCGHEWIQRGRELPKVCPNLKCKSPYWNKTRERETGKKLS